MNILLLFLIFSAFLPDILTTFEEFCSKEDPNCEEPVNSVMVDAASKSKIVEEDEFGDTDEVSQDKDGGQLHKMLMDKAGHTIVEGSLEKVHCQPDVDSFLSNGYYRAVSKEGEQKVRVMAFLPGQGLQPHAHDDVEDIKVSFGMVAYFTWLEGPGVPSNRTVTAGQPVGCASGVTHALFAGPDGAVFQESLARKGGDRQTWFAPMIRD